MFVYQCVSCETSSKTLKGKILHKCDASCSCCVPSKHEHIAEFSCTDQITAAIHVNVNKKTGYFANIFLLLLFIMQNDRMRTKIHFDTLDSLLV